MEVNKVWKEQGDFDLYLNKTNIQLSITLDS